MRSRGTLALLGIISLLLYLGLTGISRQFNWGEGYAERPILLYLAIYFSLFCLYAGACAVVLKHRDDRFLFWMIIGFGLLCRVAILPAHQIQEDDIYRYLWDGKVFAHGINPYEYAPGEVLDFTEFKIKEPGRFEETYSERNKKELELLSKLRWETDDALTVIERVNHPHVSTIYPPMAQYVFRMVHNVRPDSILAMRLGFLVFDLMALAFIFLILEAMGKGRNLCLIYFWSPLVIKETFNSTHLDIIGISFLCASIYFLCRSRSVLATLFLALSVLGKLYPVILFPLYLQRFALQNKKAGRPFWAKCSGLALLFMGVMLLLSSPFFGSGWKTFEGLKTFATYWQSNDSIFALVLYFYQSVLPGSLAGITLFSNTLAVFSSKATVLAAVLALLVCFLKQGTAPQDSPEPLIKRIFFLMGAVFLLSPVQNPWYLCWVVPFMCLFPWRSWILLTGLVGMYYLDFYFDYQDIPQYSSWIPWFEYTPFYLFLIYEWRSARGSNGAASGVHSDRRVAGQ